MTEPIPIFSPPVTPITTNNLTTGNITTRDQRSEYEAETILRRIKEAYQRPKLLAVEDLLCEDEQWHKTGQPVDKPSIQLNTMAISRGEDKITTQLFSDLNLAWEKKATRRTSNFNKGFFSERGQPYESLGHVYTSPADLLRSTLMSDIVDRMAIKYNVKRSHIKPPNQPTQTDSTTKRESTTKQNTPKSMTKAAPALATINPSFQSDLNNDADTLIGSGIVDDSAGISLIRGKLALSNKMRTNVSGDLDLITALDQRDYKECGLEYYKDKSQLQGNVTESQSEQSYLGSESPLLKEQRTVSRRKNRSRQKEHLPWTHMKMRYQTLNTIAEGQSGLERESAKRKKTIENIKMHWGKVRAIGKIVNATKSVSAKVETAPSNDVCNDDKKRYLSVINQLLCAMYNMKIKSVKASEPLSEAAMKELMNSDIELDQEDRPRPKLLIRQKPFIFRRKSMAMKDPAQERVALMMRRITKRGLKDVVKISKLMKDQSKVATWEDLVALDDNGMVPSSPIKGKPRINKTPAPLWLRVDRHGVGFFDQYSLENDSSTETIHSSESSSVGKMRREFEHKKSMLTKDLNLELEYRRQQQASLVRSKLLSLELGPISSIALEKMREDASRMVKDQQLLTPLKTPAWFAKLERNFSTTAFRSNLGDLSRFQRYPVTGMCDSSKLSSRLDIQQNKQANLRALDKLCLVMASLPVYEVLNERTTKAFDFIIQEILGFPEEIYLNWVRLRKLRQ